MMNTKKQNSKTIKKAQKELKNLIYRAKNYLGITNNFNIIELALIDDDGEVTTITMKIDIHTKLYNNKLPF